MEYNSISETETHDWRVMWVSGHFKPNVFEGITPQQKINHFPGSTEITHKNTLAENIRRQKTLFGADYEFSPETYILPNEYEAARHRINHDGGVWISKPYSQSQGKGIYLVSSPILIL